MAVSAKSLRIWIGAIVLLVWSVLVFGAGRVVEGRRVVDALASPDGRIVAFVREEASLDPPKQSLWIGPARGQAVQVARLAEDQDWSDQIFWSPDGSRVGFLIRGSFAEVFDARQRNRIAQITLVEPDGYPGSREARTVAFTPDGGLRFQECARGRDLCFGSREVRLP
jgi:dipeptidyl aminopeptidase/acylaminoacyl peptidase